MSSWKETERIALARAHVDYIRLRESEAKRPDGDQLDLPQLALVAVYVRHEDIALDEAAFDGVHDALDAGDGWCRLRSAIVWSGEDWPDQKEAGPPLFAEWCMDAATSGRLRVLSREGPPQARLWTYSERPLDPSESLREGEVAALREERWALAHGAPPGVARLHYHVYWGADRHEDVHALRRQFDRFAGFGKE